MKGDNLDVNVKLKIIRLYEVWQLVKNQNRMVVLINFIDIVYHVEEEIIQYILNQSKQNFFLFFMNTYWWNSFHNLSWSLRAELNENIPVLPV
jgi:hypothetical protein